MRLVPGSLVNYLKLLRIQAKFGRHIQIRSPYVSLSANLSHGTSIAYGCEIGDRVSIGKYSYVEPNTTIIFAEVGKFCSIGKNCQIGGWEHPINYITTSPKVYRNVIKKPEVYSDLPVSCVIGNDVWIGSNVIVKGGVTIGDGAIIGAGAVVTKDIPAYAIAVGVPAIIRKYRFDEFTINKLLELQWWDWSEDKIREHEQIFLSKEEWLDYL